MTEYIANEIKNFWLSRWEYIGAIDAIKEAKDAGYDYKIGELKRLYDQVEEYQLEEV